MVHLSLVSMDGTYIVYECRLKGIEQGKAVTKFLKGHSQEDFADFWSKKSNKE